MEFQFTKIQGTGNDFVVIYEPSRERFAQINKIEMCKQICPRKFGIGCDQLLILHPDKKAKETNNDNKNSNNEASFEMRVFNSDGSEAQNCGNGLRAVGLYLLDREKIGSSLFSIHTIGGTYSGKVLSKEENFGMIEVTFQSPVVKKPFHEINIESKTFSGSLVNIGNPHFVIFCDLKSVSVTHDGPLIEKTFDGGINVEFAQVIENNNNIVTIKAFVWERGSGETLSCGSGASSIAWVIFQKFNKAKLVKIQMKGGEIQFRKINNQLVMMGPAKIIFDGKIKIYSTKK
ncbi:diaminopimelate epimerase [Anaeramoeba flamelloides]|uniref:diaminopimelate epimerase n=1 Tax=Anaeramoeba flamelloides TaxID=1746091 RepID=A0ABQ8Z109_9EUKA|nr:diaminopimelate epimerase [Anaeramoeba flamelloides]